MMRVGAGIGVQGDLMPTTKTMTRPAPPRIGVETPIWDAEFAARWDAIQHGKPSVAAAPVKRKPGRPSPQK
jgi:hypothetical protein